MFIYRQNTTIFISSILGIYYNRHNYMFRPLEKYDERHLMSLYIQLRYRTYYNFQGRKSWKRDSG